MAPAGREFEQGLLAFGDIQVKISRHGAPSQIRQGKVLILLRAADEARSEGGFAIERQVKTNLKRKWTIERVDTSTRQRRFRSRETIEKTTRRI